MITDNNGKIRMSWWQGLNNFGDQLSPLIVQKITGREVVHVDRYPNSLLALGSILHKAEEGNAIWGTGMNTKQYRGEAKWTQPENLDIRAVRGPITRDFLKFKGYDCPRFYGDPAALMPILFSEYKPEPTREYGIVPHFSDIERMRKAGVDFIDVRKNWRIVLEEILSCEKIIASSLHAVIVAEAYGIPAVWLSLSHFELMFKFLDYYLGTGRIIEPVYTLEEAYKHPGEPLPDYDAEKLLKAFPHYLVE